MAKAIWKFSLPPDLNGRISTPTVFQPLAIQMQDGWPCLWAIVDPYSPQVDRDIRVYGTGHPMRDDQELDYLGTFQMNAGMLVFHAFLVKE